MRRATAGARRSEEPWGAFASGSLVRGGFVGVTAFGGKAAVRPSLPPRRHCRSLLRQVANADARSKRKRPARRPRVPDATSRGRPGLDLTFSSRPSGAGGGAIAMAGLRAPEGSFGLQYGSGCADGGCALRCERAARGEDQPTMRDESASAARQRDFDGRGCWVSERSLGAGDENVVGCLIPRDRQRARREGSAPFPVAAGPDQGTSAQGARWTLERGVQPVAQLRDGGGRWTGEQRAVSGQSDAQGRAWACHRCKRCSRRRIGGRGGDELLPPSFGIARIAGGDQSPRLGRGKAARRRAPQLVCF